MNEQINEQKNEEKKCVRPNVRAFTTYFRARDQLITHSHKFIWHVPATLYYIIPQEKEVNEKKREGGREK